MWNQNSVDKPNWNVPTPASEISGMHFVRREHAYSCVRFEGQF
jgi:hypothetical protein